MAAVQVSVSSYLLVSHSPDLVFTEDSQTVVCAASFQQRLHSHLYNVLLLAITVILYMVYQEVRLTFLEAKYVGVSSLLSGPIMVCWVVAGLTVHTEDEDFATILGLLATSIVTGLNMLLLVRLHSQDDGGYRDGYKQARKLTYFSIFPTKRGWCLIDNFLTLSRSLKGSGRLYAVILKCYKSVISHSNLLYIEIY